MDRKLGEVIGTYEEILVVLTIMVSNSTQKKPKHFLSFKTDITAQPLPEKFTFPFYYQPHPLSRLAARELQEYLQAQKEWEHNFGLGTSSVGKAIGKMFGVLIVQDQQGEVGYLAAFSGKLANSNDHKLFVPPVFDILKKEGFFKKGEQQLDELNGQIEVIKNSPDFKACQQALADVKQQAKTAIEQRKAEIKKAKNNRKTQRQQALHKGTAFYETLSKKLNNESFTEQTQLKKLKRHWKQQIAIQDQQLVPYQSKIQQLKDQRKQQSAALQQQLFKSYHFLNQYGVAKNLLDIFKHTTLQIPPAGAGECAAPKLLQYAFQHQLTPLAMAEFWWGASPISAIRKHQQFYPTCRGKCEPILLHMLEGINMEKNPMLTNPAKGKKLAIIYEDDYLLAINKPTEFLAVPGKHIQDSVWLRMKQQFPTATGPLIVHRLDMSTSGIMLIAKSKDIHQQLQQQFIARSVQKKYIALLKGVINEKEGLIDLPLRVDLENRPHQLVCFKYGKAAQTKWKVVEYYQQETLIHFFPITGRTHQLRVHAAHPLGLNAPIKGDDLYGTRANRLYLHAGWIVFTHPVTKKSVEIEVEANWI